MNKTSNIILRHPFSQACRHPKLRHSLQVGHALLISTLMLTGCARDKVVTEAPAAKELSDDQIKNIVERSYQYVAMYNVNNKFALKQGGWNSMHADTQLKDHTMREIARPNNDSLYISCLLNLCDDAVVLEMPAIDSEYVSLMITAYDHYVNVPMATRLGDFRKSERILIYSARTQGYQGEPVEGVDRIFKATGDFVSAVFRVMPHGNEPERFQRITQQMKQVKLATLSEFRGEKATPITPVTFPPVGKTDMDVFENNLLEVMQFVFNHTTFDPADNLDQAVLAAYKPLGVDPGQTYDPSSVAKIDGRRFRAIAERVQQTEFARSQNPEVMKQLGMHLFQAKGHMSLEALLLQSVIGPIGLPATEAIYRPVVTPVGEPLNAQHDYVVRMSKDGLPPATAFWSLTLYDAKNGFFIPNDRKKYSVGENAGMKLNAEGGIKIYVAARQPEGVPEENWLPITRKDEDMDMILRIYVPDLQKMKTWQPPKAEKLSGQLAE